MIKRNVLLAGVVVLMGMSQAQAAVSYDDLYTLENPLKILALPMTGEGGTIGGVEYTSQGFSATYWSESNPDGIQLAPKGEVHFVKGDYQLGYVSLGTSTSSIVHAALWQGTPGSLMDLNPQGSVYSIASGMSGDVIVGVAKLQDTPQEIHAVLWSGPSYVVTDLNPAGFIESQVDATNGLQHVGMGKGASTGNKYHALLWSGTSNEAIDLNPLGYTSSEAFFVQGDVQLGSAADAVTGNNHAMMWYGTANSAVDLNNSAYDVSCILSANDQGIQVGYAGNLYFDPGWGAYVYKRQAVAWFGTADSCINLQALLPADYNESYALSVIGNVVYGVAYNRTEYQWHAISWTVPEPGSLGLLGIGAMGLMRRRRMA